jgi:hypothetical protein
MLPSPPEAEGPGVRGYSIDLPNSILSQQVEAKWFVMEV